MTPPPPFLFKEQLNLPLADLRAVPEVLDAYTAPKEGVG